MTMKRQKTLHRFAAVAAVLLTLCLVFMMPVGATETVVEITESDFVEDSTNYPNEGKVYVIDLSGENVADTYKLTETVDGKIILRGEIAKALNITSNAGVVLNGYIRGAMENHAHVNGAYALYPITIEGMTFTLDESDFYDYDGSYDWDDSGVYAISFMHQGQQNVGQGHFPLIKIKNNVFNFAEEISTAEGNDEDAMRSYMFFVSSGGVTDGSEFTGNTVNGVTALPICFAGAGTSVDKQAVVTIEDNTVTITPTGAIATNDDNVYSLIKFYQNSQNNVKYVIEGNTVIIDDAKLTDGKSTAILSVFPGDYATSSISLELTNNKILNTDECLISKPIVHYNKGSSTDLESVSITSEVIISPVTGGEVTASAESIKAGEEVILTIAEDAGYTSTALTYTDSTGSHDILSEKKFTMPFEPVTVTGSFEAIPYTVTVNGGSATQETATVGTTITLTANDPESGFVFKEWQVISGGVTITGNEFTMPAANVEITAVFEEKKEEPVTPPTEDTPEPVEPSFEDAVETETTEEGVKVTINAAESSVSTSTDGKTYFIEDEESGVTLTLFFTEVPSSEDSETPVSGVVEHVSANYNYDAGTNSESDITDIDVHLSIGLDSPDTPLPKINPEFKEELSQKIKETHSDHTPLAMITAETNVDAINNNLTKKDNRVPLVITFMIDASSLAGIDLTQHKFVGYHISGDSVDIIDAHWSEDGGKIIITLNGKHFSSYAVGIAPASSESGEGDDTPSVTPSQRPSSGGSTDTGSGNYNEYPRQADGKAGEISFGSSKDVKAVDLPEGVTGEVKLIAKSTHPAPEGKETHKVFEINIPNYPTGKPATIKFEMTLADIEAKGLTAADVCLYHFNKETGLWEKLPTTFKVVDGKVYFEAVTTGFSPFAIVFEEGAATPAAGADEPVTPPTETPDVPETPGTLPPVDTPETPEQPTESPAPILAVLAGLGAAVVLRRK